MQGLDIWQRRKPLIYENLVWIDHALEPKPELAERWEQKSPTEYVFHLRRGVRFHTGKEMDAEDVKYRYERVRDPKGEPGRQRPRLRGARSDRAVDKYTVRFLALSAPAATFLVNLAGKYNGVIPKDAGGDGRAPLTTAIGTGPFALDSFDPEPAAGSQAQWPVLGRPEAAAREHRLPGHSRRVLDRGRVAHGADHAGRVLLGAHVPGGQVRADPRGDPGAVHALGGARSGGRSGAHQQTGGPPGHRARHRPPGRPADRGLGAGAASRPAAARAEGLGAAVAGAAEPAARRRKGQAAPSEGRIHRARADEDPQHRRVPRPGRRSARHRGQPEGSGHRRDGGDGRRRCVDQGLDRAAVAAHHERLGRLRGPRPGLLPPLPLGAGRQGLSALEEQRRPTR